MVDRRTRRYQHYMNSAEQSGTTSPNLDKQNIPQLPQPCGKTGDRSLDSQESRVLVIAHSALGCVCVCGGVPYSLLSWDW